MPRKLLRGLVVITTFSVVVTVAAVSPSMAGSSLPAVGTVSATPRLSPQVARTVKGAGAAAREQALANNDLAYDLGVAIVSRDSVDLSIQDYLGAQGIAFSQPLQLTFAYGYPASFPYTGNDLWGAVDYTSDDGSSIIRMGNSMNQGSSGGPWLIEFNSHYGKVSGNNGFIRPAYPGRMHSPYYGHSTAGFYTTVESFYG